MCYCGNCCWCSPWFFFFFFTQTSVFWEQNPSSFLPSKLLSLLLHPHQSTWTGPRGDRSPSEILPQRQLLVMTVLTFDLAQGSEKNIPKPWHTRLNNLPKVSTNYNTEPKIVVRGRNRISVLVQCTGNNKCPFSQGLLTWIMFLSSILHS